MNIFSSLNGTFEKIQYDYAHYLNNRGTKAEIYDLSNLIPSLYHLREGIRKDILLCSLVEAIEFCNSLWVDESFILIKKLANLIKHYEQRSDTPDVICENGFRAGINRAGQALDVSNIFANNENLDLIIEKLIKKYDHFFKLIESRAKMAERIKLPLIQD